MHRQSLFLCIDTSTSSFFGSETMLRFPQPQAPWYLFGRRLNNIYLRLTTIT